MTTLQSGHITTSTNTPTGAVKKIAVDNPYLTSDDFITTAEAIGLGITSTHVLYTSGELDKIILRASAYVNRYCRRYFDTQTIDETKTGFQVRPYNPQLVTNVLNNRPYQKINSIYIQVLKWFIQVDTSSSNSYLQDFPDFGYYKIVPLLSSSGQGAGSPIPAAILDKIALGILWTNYTFGYGTQLTAQVPTGVVDGVNKTFQAVQGNRLFAPDQTLTVYDNGVAVLSTAYTVDYPNGKVTFTTAPISGHAITLDFTTNESIPADIKEALILVVAHLVGQALNNPTGATSLSMQTFSISWGNKSAVKERFEELLESYVNRMPKII